MSTEDVFYGLWAISAVNSLQKETGKTTDFVGESSAGGTIILSPKGFKSTRVIQSKRSSDHRKLLKEEKREEGGNALQSKVLCLREEMFLVDARLGTPRICMQDEPIGVPINRATSFENRVGFLDLVAGESLIKEQILERFFIDLVAGESLIKERAAARFNDLVGSTDVVVGEPLLLLPRRFRQNRAWMELNKIL
ncbi:hypothetical protein BC332_25551 [Capsicum chinense]|nr:hypothetical protein BC332_25551 [Capsicum chinense]